MPKKSEHWAASKLNMCTVSSLARLLNYALVWTEILTKYKEFEAKAEKIKSIFPALASNPYARSNFLFTLRYSLVKHS